jgi:hypothetical protein
MALALALAHVNTMTRPRIPAKHHRKEITLTLPPAVIRKGRARARALGMSLSRYAEVLLVRDADNVELSD